MQAINGATRFVVVQPSTYGFDNRVLVNALLAAKGVAKGVAVVPTDSSRVELESLKKAGVVGLRANLTLGPHTVRDLRRLALLAIEFDFHLQLNLTGRQLIDNLDDIQRLPVPVVIDHCAYLCREPELAPTVFSALQTFLEKQNRWLKASGPYVASTDVENNYADLSGYITQLVAAFPAQIVYGSDWPHVTESTQPGERHLFAIQQSWFGETNSQRMILSTNPARLYGFNYERPSHRRDEAPGGQPACLTNRSKLAR